MSRPRPQAALPGSVRLADARGRATGLVDAGSWREHADARPSPWLERWGIPSRADDGVIVGAGSIDGKRIFVVSQDAGFLGGSVGAGHAVMIECAIRLAIAERVPAILLLLDSGGVRLHEANAAEVALARALRALLDARAGGVRTLALVVGNCFGGASVLACACESRWMLPATRLGLSGPKVIESARGRGELDTGDAHGVDAIAGAAARAAQGVARLRDDSFAAVRRALAATIAAPARALDAAALAPRIEALAARLAESHGLPARTPRWLTRLPGVDATLLRAFAPAPMGPANTLSADRALLAWLADARRDRVREPLVIIEDSPGHLISRAAEIACLSDYLALHAQTLAVIRHAGHPVIGVVAGAAHSAAFFVNALQADALAIVAGARLEVMDRAAIMRVTGRALPAHAGDDAVLSSSPRSLFALGAAELELARLDAAALSGMLTALAHR